MLDKSKKRLLKKLETLLKGIEHTSFRLTPVGDKIFLILIRTMTTKKMGGFFWVDENGIRKDFNYAREQVVASGKTDEELLASVEYYVKLSNMNTTDFLEERLNPHNFINVSL